MSKLKKVAISQLNLILCSFAQLERAHKNPAKPVALAKDLVELSPELSRALLARILEDTPSLGAMLGYDLSPVAFSAFMENVAASGMPDKDRVHAMFKPA